jgi:hypothetical protein
VADVNLPSCSTEQEIADAYAAWSSGFSVIGGCNTTSNLGQLPALPSFVCGGAVSLSFTLSASDDCTSDSCSGTFNVEGAEALAVSCPTPVALGSSLSQQEITDAYNNWVSGFGVSGGCNATSNIANIPSLPDYICGIAINLNFSLNASDDCGQDSCTSSFAVEGRSSVYAGEDGILTLCEDDTNSYDLFAQLTNADLGGSWTDPNGDDHDGSFEVGSITGNYIYTVRGDDPCPNDSAIVFVTVNPLPEIIIAAEGPFCSYDLPVQLSVNQTGGVWSGDVDENGVFDPASGSGSATYTYTNDNACTNSSTINIQVNSQPEITLMGNPECTDNAQTYSVTVLVSDGEVTSDYGTPVDNGGNSWTIFGIQDDINVTLTVTSDSGCDNTLNVQAPDCICIELDYDYENVSCNGLNDGTILVTYVTPGALVTVNGSPYNPDTLYAPGEYTIRAYFEGVDIDECIITDEIEITEPELVNFDLSYTNVTCHGADNGTITISNLSDGAFYTIQLNGYGPDLSGQSYFAPGTYLILARLEANSSRYSFDAVSAARADDPCQKARLITISEPKELSCEILAEFNMDDLRCRSNSQTYLTAVGTDGTGTLSYSWELDSNSSWEIISDVNEPMIYFRPGVRPATFTVQISDENGCQTECSIVVTSTCTRGRSVTIAPSFSGDSNGGSRSVENFEPLDVQLYPNPVKDQLSIKFDSEMTSKVVIEVFDLVGTVVYSNTYSASETNNLSIDFSKFESQVYYVKITTDDGIVIKQVVLDK